MTKKTQPKPVSISPNMQTAFLGTLFLLWAGTFATFFLWVSNSYISLGTILFQISQAGLPVVWYMISLWLVWDRYKTILNRFFYAGFVTLITFGMYLALSSLEQTLRFRYYPPVIADFDDKSLLTAFGHEWMIAGIGLGIFVAIVCWIKFRPKATEQ